jgi:Ca2+/H+ antiporter
VRAASLIFPRWDVIALIFSVFLMTYTYIEAKSNYHRGSMLILRYTRCPRSRRLQTLMHVAATSS